MRLHFWVYRTLKPTPLLLCLAGLLAGCTGTAEEHGEALFSDPTVTGNENGVFACSTCHALTEGAEDGPILTGAPLAGVVDRPHFWGGQELELLRAVNYCLYYFMYQSQPWTGEEVEARALYAYLDAQTASGNTSPAPFTVVYEVYDVPRGDAGSGESLYARACESCHGALHTGEGALAESSPILPEEFLEVHPSDVYSESDRRLVMIEKIRHGAFVGYSGQMPPFSEERLSDAQVGDLLEYLGLLGE